MALSNKKILITGATGQVAAPIAHYLARNNQVWCIARFTPKGSRAALEAHVASHPRGKHGAHEYRLEEYGLSPEQVLHRFAPYLERFDVGEDRGESAP